MKSARQALADITAYADERAWYGRRQRTVDSARIASDLQAILADVEPEPAVRFSEGEAAVRTLRALGYVKSTDHVTGSVQWFPSRPAVVLDRDAAQEKLRAWRDSPLRNDGTEDVLDALEGCVRPAPVQTIDRDAAAEAAFNAARRDDWGVANEDEREEFYDIADAVLALLRPVEGVTLTREEAAYAQRWLPTKNSQRARDIAARLEAAS